MAKTKKKKSNQEKKVALGIDSRTRRLLIKINQEQVVYYNEPDGNEELSKRVDRLIELKKKINEFKEVKDDAIAVAEVEKLSAEFDKAMKEKNEWLAKYCEEKGYLKSFFENIRSIDKDQFEVYAAPHDKDVFWDNFFQSHPEDYHIHIVFLGKVNTVSNKRRIFKVSDALDMLHIRYDEKRDLSVLDNGAIQVCKYIHESIQYLLHWTALSEEEGKFIYDRAVLITNDEETADTYLNTTPEMGKTHLMRMTAEEAASYAPAFIEQGKSLVSFKNAFLNVGFPEWFYRSAQGKRAIMGVFQQAYEEGLDATISLRRVDRICLFIYGKHEIGKTTAVEHLCDTLGITRDKIFITAEGYGKYDGLTPQHEVLLADDVSLQNMLTLADERVAKLSQRNKGYSIFAGSLVIATSNVKPDEFFHKNKEDKLGNVLVDKSGVPRVSELYEARISRFAVIKANDDGSFTFERPITRGSRNNTAFEKKAIVQNLIDIMQESTKEYCSNISMSDEDILKYPSYDVAKLCKTLSDADFVAFVENHIKDFGDNLDLYYEAYRDDTPALLGDDDIEIVLFDDGSVVSL